MHENFIFMHESMKFPCMKMTFSCMKMKILPQESFSSPRKFSLGKWMYTISCMEFSSMNIFGQKFHFHAGKRNVHAWNIHATIFSCMKHFVRVVITPQTS